MIEDIFLPERFQAMIYEDLGRQTGDTLLEALQEAPETSLRLNRRKPTAGSLFPDMQPVDWCRSGFYLTQRPIFTSDPLLHAGVYYVQDASSMVYETIVAAIAGNSPLMAADLCAAPGGKTTAMLNALPDGSGMLANEFIPSRANILKENLVKYGYPEIVVTNTDVSRLAKMKGMFNLVAVDAPCSGEGMMRKEVTARSQWSEGLIRQCVGMQRTILESAMEMLAPGGFLIYSTCTFNTMEDEDNASWIAEHPEFQPFDTGLAGKFNILPEAKGEIPCLRFLPGFTRGEGLFVSVFRKCIDADSRTTPHSPKKNKRKAKPKTDERIISHTRSWLDGDFEILDHEGHLLALTPAALKILQSLPDGVRIMCAGVEAAEVKGKDIIPSHQLAMSTALSHVFPEVELSKDEALRYLARENISLPESTPKGFVIATFKGHPLGFLKNHGNRSNNLYPQDYRIRNLKK